jgi:hypothetical protein
MNVAIIFSASPLKVVKAEINAPIKQKKSPSISQILNSQVELPSAPISATELRVRLERLLAESTHETKCSINASQNPSVRPESRARSENTAPVSPVPPNISKPVSVRVKKSKKSANSNKFKGKISGKNITVIQRENDIRYVKDNVKVNKKSKSDKSKRSEKKSSKNKLKEEEIVKNDELENNLSPEKVDIDNGTRNEEQVVKGENEEQNLMLQPENLRQNSKDIVVTDVDDHEEGCFRDPGRSLALVKEWRRRLEATRASCEQMLAQLKAFRDPPQLKSQQALMVAPTVDFPSQVPMCHADSCISLGSKLRKLSNKAEHKVIVTSIESIA